MATKKKAISKKKVAKKKAVKKAVADKSGAKNKKCARCLKRKSLDSFGVNTRMKLGRKSYCRACSSKLQREWNANQRTAEKPKRKRR